MPWKPAGGGNDHLSRTPSKSIRGHISSPIPISGPMDEDFPMRDQNIMIAASSDETPHETSLIFHGPGGKNHTPRTSRARTTLSGNLESLNSSSASAQRSTMRESSATHSRQLTQSSEQAGSRSSKAANPQRKKSTIRSAFSKLFGRKKNTEGKEKSRLSNGRTSDISRSLPNEQNTTDSTSERQNQMSGDPKRSLSMPITEYDRALRSHSIGPDDVMAIRSARNSITADAALSPKTLQLFAPPTYLHSPKWAGGSKLAGLSPRPASSQDRATRMAGISDDPSEIGRAISSDARGLKRRSRSLSVMPSFDLASQGVIRRRSAEIRYWRESYVAPFMSPTSTTADEEIRQLLSGDVEEAASHTEQPFKAVDQLITPVEPGSTNRQTPTLAQMKDPAEPVDGLNLESRVGSLETRMSRLESIVLQLGQSIPALRQPSNTQPRLPGASQQGQARTADDVKHAGHLQLSEVGLADEPRRSTSRPSTRHSDASKMTFGDVHDVTPRATIFSPTDGEPQLGLFATPRGMDVSSKARHGSVTFEHYTNLIALFETERSAREALEAQVKSLGRQIQILNRSMAYNNTDQSESPSLDRSLGEVSVFDHDDEDEEDVKHRRLNAATGFAYNSLGMEDSGIATEHRSDDEYTESFVTPLEMGKANFGMYEDINENDPMLSNGRKLSLSHLTMRQPLAAIQQTATNLV